MKIRIIISGVVLLVGGLAQAPAHAARPESTPVTAVAVATGGNTLAAFQFDVGGFEEAIKAGRSVFLEWSIDGVPGLERSEYVLYPIVSSWTAVSAAEGLDLAEESVAIWTIEPRDHARAGGLVRFEVTGLVAAWLAHEAPNRGLAVVTDALSARELDSQLSAARLVVR